MGVFRADRLETHVVVKTIGDAIGPFVEFSASPFKAVIGVAELAGGQGFPVGVVLGVGRGDEYGGRMRAGEDDAFAGGQARRVQVFDDLHEDGGVVSLQAGIAVQKRAVE